MTTKPGQIFISYARTDAICAIEIERDLRTLGFRSWRDTRDLDPSQDFTGELEEAIRASSHIVVCLTPGVQQPSSFVRREIAYALQRQKPIIPLLFEGGELPIMISTWTYVNMRDHETGLAQLAKRLQRSTSSDGTVIYADSPELVSYLNALHEWASMRLQESVDVLITLATVSIPKAVSGKATETFSFNFVTSPVLGSPSFAGSPTSSPRSKSRHFSTLNEASEYYDGRLLLLGEPGGGKTTTLLAFARDAAVKRLSDSSAPVPVLASIHRWDQRTAVSQWATTEAGVDLRGQHVLYLLDGLDELGSKQPDDPAHPDQKGYDPRKSFLLNVQEHIDGPVIISSRTKDYEEIGTRSTLNGAVTLQPLTGEQIEDYMQARGHPELWVALQADSALMDISRTPLLLAILTIALTPGESTTSIHTLSDIFDQYVHKRFIHEMAKAGHVLFDEITTRVLLGKIARFMWRSWLSPQAEITLFQAKRLLGSAASSFLDFGCRMDCLRYTGDNTIGFMHLKLRDYFVVVELTSILNEGTIYERGEALDILDRIGDSSCLPSILNALHDPDDSIRWRAAEYLRRVAEPTTFLAQLEALHDSSKNVRWRAADGLGRIGDSRAVPELLGALSDSEPDVRESVADALGQIGDPNSLDGLLKAMGDIDVGVRESVVRALGRLGKAALPGLRKAVRNRDVVVRKAAVAALGESDIPEAVDELSNCLSDSNWEVNSAAVEALGATGDPRAVHILP